ncbi:hypothetical protein [Inhella gelatinilytica]|nr:hypothetical protein [Inhella gelatinilytica]
MNLANTTTARLSTLRPLYIALHATAMLSTLALTVLTVVELLA